MKQLGRPETKGGENGGVWHFTPCSWSHRLFQARGRFESIQWSSKIRPCPGWSRSLSFLTSSSGGYRVSLSRKISMRVPPGGLKIDTSCLACPFKRQFSSRSRRTKLWCLEHSPDNMLCTVPNSTNESFAAGLKAARMDEQI